MLNCHIPKELGLDRILDAGGELTVRKDREGVTYIDLNTGMKSYLHLYCLDGVWYLQDRYSWWSDVDSWDTILDAAKDCLHGREYMHPAWQKILEEDGYIRVETRTVETVFIGGREALS